MLNTVEAIAQLLQNSLIKAHDIQTLTIDESEQFAFGIKVDRSRLLEAWHLMRSLLEQTKRYPIVVEGWGSDDFFSRFYYREERLEGKLQDTSPESIMAQVATANLAAFLETRKVASAAYLEDSASTALEITKAQFGSCPDEAQIRSLIETRTIRSTVDLEKWLLNWELQTFGRDVAIADSDLGYLDWFEPDNPTLLLLPIEQGWDALAYLHWFGACAAGTPVAIGLLKKWHQQYNAELVCHYGTMLQLTVGRRPSSIEEAFELAWEQVALAECTTMLPGVTLREHARSLMAAQSWFLHERP